MDRPEIRTAGEELKEKLIAILLLAFAADPFSRWLMPEPIDFVKNFGRQLMAMAGKSFENNAAFYATDFSVAALWLPPGVTADETLLVSTLFDIIPENIQENMKHLGAEIDKYHPETCWYLSHLGTEPNMQGQGRGALIMKDILQRCDLEKMPAYLESSNPKNIPFYERHGFEIMTEINVGNPVPLTPMIREPQ